MKQIKFLSIAALTTFSLLSCSGPVHVQKDDSANLANYHTYMWVDSRANDQDKSAKPTAYVDLSVRNAVNAELSKRGWKEVPDNPDVLLSYDVLVERTTERQSDPVYTQPFTRVYYNPYTRRWGTIYYPSRFIGYQTYEVPVKEGTVTLTMMDAKTDKTVWQGWTTERLNYSRITEKEISKSVKNILQKLEAS